MLSRALHLWARRARVLDPAGEVQPFGSRTVVRSLGAVGLCAAVLILVWLALPHPAELHEGVMAGLALATGALGTLLLSGRLDGASPAVLHGLVSIGYSLVAVGVAVSGPAIAGLTFLYLWVIPFAYLCFALRAALAHSFAMTGVNAAALALVGSTSAMVISRTVFLLGTAVVVGLLMRALTMRMRSVDERFRRSFRDSATAMVMVDLQGRLQDVNAAFCALVARPREHLIGTSLMRLTHPDDLQRTLTPLRAGEDAVVQRLLRPAGEAIWVRIDGGLIDADGSRHFFGLVHDVTAAHAAEADRSRQSRQQAAIARLGRLALRELDLDALCAEVARVLHETLGTELTSVSRYHAAEGRVEVVAGVGWREHADLSWPVQPGSLSDAALRADGAVRYDASDEDGPRGSLSLRSHEARSGLMVTIDGSDGSTWGFIGAYSTANRAFEPDEAEFLAAVATVLSSAVERTAAEERMRYLALHDALTGLPNRELAADRLAVALARRQRHRSAVAVLMLDLDNFTVVNDSLGHAAGDRLLEQIAPRLEAAVRPEDTVARVGGDEFLIVCDGGDPAVTPTLLAERALAAVRAPVVLESGERFVTASIGVAVAESADADSDALIRDADVALYRAKERGRNRYELFDESLRRRAMARLQVEYELRRALDRGELRVHYQPVVDLESRLPVGVEALVRWDHPERGLLLPGEFVPLAEETGLIARLGDQVLRTACAETASWQKRFGTPLQLAVNVSGRQLSDPAFGARVAQAAAASGMARGTLRVEITETVLVAEAESAAPVLGDLHQRGLGVVLDDFGTGYSSLSYLKRFSVDALKIDQVFVADMVVDEGDRAIVDTVLRMSESLGIEAIAEGVETVAQADALRTLGCGLAQGYLFAPALDPEALEGYLAQALGAGAAA